MKKFNYLGLPFGLLIMILLSCDKEDHKNSSNCDVVNPVEELEWLKSNIEEIEQRNDEFSKYAYYMSAKYEGEAVFFYGNCHPLINYVSFVLNCKGDSIGNTNDHYNKLTEIKVIWRPEGSLCGSK